MPSRNGVRDQIHHVAESVKDKVSFLFFSFLLSSFFLLTHQIRGLTRSATYPVFCADLWKSKARDYYVAVTVQFIDPLWKLHNVPVGFVQIVGPHTNEAVGRMIHEILQPFLGVLFLLFFLFSLLFLSFFFFSLSFLLLFSFLRTWSQTSWSCH